MQEAVEIEERMGKTIEATLQEFNSVRTGRASPALVESLQIEYYGSKTPLNQLASITVPEPRLLLIRPWDKTAVKEIRKAVAASSLGLNPVVDENALRIVIPELTEERRVELTRVVRQIAEKGRVAIRNVRRRAVESIRKSEKAGDISKDDRYGQERDVQEITDQYIEELDRLLKEKEDELMNR
ncbi:MAG: ribosome recycling factor [Candidatus Poribacteria bacterium]|nr:ribosome recycling factor [Candidatus Poribacteria bacterium]